MVALAAGFAAAASAGNAQPFAGGDCPGAYGAGPGMMGWGGGGPHGMGPRGGYGPQAGPGWMGPRGFGPGFNRESNAEARLAYLKSELKISAEQDAAWNAYGAAVKQQATQMQAFRTAMFKAQTPQERLSLHAEQAKQRAAGFETLEKGLRDLYAVLNTEQQALADVHLGRMRFGQTGPRGRWH